MALFDVDNWRHYCAAAAASHDRITQHVNYTGESWSEAAADSSSVAAAAAVAE